MFCGLVAMDLDFTPVLDSARFLLGGLGLTLALSLLTILCSLALGGAIGLARCYGPAWLRWPLVFYIDSMRSVPVLVVLVWTYFALPFLTGVTLPPFWAALVALTAHIAVYVAEVVRAGVTSIRAGQSRAAFALGMSRAQAVRTIILPQAIVRMLPAFGSILSITIKDTAIAAVIAVPEYMNRSQTVAGQSFHPIEVFVVAMVVYFLILFPVTRVVDIVYVRFAHLGRS
jgi:polar amino acid transport system permease protein